MRDAPLSIATVMLMAAFLASPVLSSRIDPNAYEGGRSRDMTERARRNTSSIAAMLGGLRTAMSDILFIKTERYLHSGVAYVPHLQSSLMSVSETMGSVDAHDAGEAQSVDPHAGHDHAVGGECDVEAGEELPTIILQAEEDFRGFIGNLHRTVKPFSAEGAHQHGDGRELLPWFRVMTTSDPNYIPGYTIGGWWLKSKEPEEALKFVTEGIARNPDSFQVLLVRGQILITLARTRTEDIFAPNPAARELLADAVRDFHAAAEIALRQRPDLRPEEFERGPWTTYLEADAWAAARMSALMEKQYGNRAHAADLARHYLDRLGDDEVLQRVVRSGD